jgi:hypothetical protein
MSAGCPLLQLVSGMELSLLSQFMEQSLWALGNRAKLLHIWYNPVTTKIRRRNM